MVVLLEKTDSRETYVKPCDVCAVIFEDGWTHVSLVGGKSVMVKVPVDQVFKILYPEKEL